MLTMVNTICQTEPAVWTLDGAAALALVGVCPPWRGGTAVGALRRKWGARFTAMLRAGGRTRWQIYYERG